MDRLTVRIDEDVKRQLDMLAAKSGKAPAAFARDLIEQGVMNEAQRAWAPLVRQAIRDEFDSFLEQERVQREFSADDLYCRLANELRLDMDDLRVLAGAALACALGLLEGSEGVDGHGGERLQLALERGLWLGFDGLRHSMMRDEDIDDGAL